MIFKVAPAFRACVKIQNNFINIQKINLHFNLDLKDITNMIIQKAAHNFSYGY
jgi:hypothetical protein